MTDQVQPHLWMMHDCICSPASKGHMMPYHQHVQPSRNTLNVQPTKQELSGAKQLSLNQFYQVLQNGDGNCKDKGGWWTGQHFHQLLQVARNWQNAHAKTAVLMAGANVFVWLVPLCSCECHWDVWGPMKFFWLDTETIAFSDLF